MGRPKTEPVTGGNFAAALVACLKIAHEFGRLRPEQLPLAAITLEDRMHEAIKKHVGRSYMVPE